MATILQIIKTDNNLSLFSKGVIESQLESKLNETGPFTVLGPVNLALNKLVSLTYDQLLEPVNQEKLMYLLSGYVLRGKKMLEDFRHDQKIPMLNGQLIAVVIRNGDTYLNGAKILAHDKQGSNGVVHLIDRTYTPAEGG